MDWIGKWKVLIKHSIHKVLFLIIFFKGEACYKKVVSHVKEILTYMTVSIHDTLSHNIEISLTLDIIYDNGFTYVVKFKKNHLGPPRTMLLVGKTKTEFWPGICTDSGDGISY